MLLAVIAAPLRAAEIEAFTKARYALEIGFTIPGKVKKVNVKPGDKVKAGDLLVQLENDEAEALVTLWTMRSESDVAVRVAKAALEMAKWERGKVEQLDRNEAGSKLELERARIQVRIETERLAQAEEQRLEAVQELARYQAQHKRYALRAPIDAVVEAIDIQVGEVVEQLEPVIALVVADPLRIDAPVPTSETLGLKAGDPAWVRMNLPGHEHPIKGEIKHMRLVADAASDTRLVRIEIPNPSGLPAGVKVFVSFRPPSDEIAKVTENRKSPDG